MKFMCLLGPAFLGLSIYYILTKGDYKLYVKVLMDYINILILSNFMTILVIYFIFKEQSLFGTMLNTNSLYFIKYLALNIIFSSLIGLIFGCIKKNVEFNIEVTKNENKKKKNK